MDVINSDSVNDVNGVSDLGGADTASGRGRLEAPQVVIQRKPRKQSSLFGPSGPTILQLNVEGLTKAKCDVIQQLCLKHSVTVILLQETHTKADDEIQLPGYSLVGALHRSHHGIATLVKNDKCCALVQTSNNQDDLQWIATRLDEVTIVNVYKPPRSPFTDLPIFNHPVIYSGDFNCQHEMWGYSQSTQDGSKLADWASNANLTLLYDNKQPKTFHSNIWNTFTNPDLSFYSRNPSSVSPPPEHLVGKTSLALNTAQLSSTILPSSRLLRQRQSPGGTSTKRTGPCFRKQPQKYHASRTPTKTTLTHQSPPSNSSSSNVQNAVYLEGAAGSTVVVGIPNATHLQGLTKTLHHPQKNKKQPLHSSTD